MKTMFSQIDRLLRGEFTQTDALAAGRVDAPVSLLLRMNVVLGAFYGACMALFPALRNGPGGFYQILSSMAKVPLLFILTLFVTVPSLYVFSALANSKLRFTATLRLLMIAISVNLAVLASLGPVVAFFALCTKSHPFMQILNVLIFVISGAVGLTVLRRTLDRVFEVMQPVEIAPPPIATLATGNAATRATSGSETLQMTGGQVRMRMIFTIWCITFCVVGAQMAWILRPFIGAPGLPFQLFRGRESNVLKGVLEALHWALRD